MRQITSRAMSGVASITITPSSPTITPVLGSPSAVNAQQLGESLWKVIRFDAVSACDAKVRVMS
jgi:hypothetical protein